MAKYSHLALTAVMLLMGLLLIVGSLLASIGTTLFPFDQYVGTRAAVAGVTFGAGIMLAAMRPAANVTWVRLAILYCVLDVLYEIVAFFWLGASGASWLALIFSIIFGALLIILYPRRADLVPHESAVTAPSPA